MRMGSLYLTHLSPPPNGSDDPSGSGSPAVSPKDDVSATFIVINGVVGPESSHKTANGNRQGHPSYASTDGTAPSGVDPSATRGNSTIHKRRLDREDANNPDKLHDEGGPMSFCSDSLQAPMILTISGPESGPEDLTSASSRSLSSGSELSGPTLVHLGSPISGRYLLVSIQAGGRSYPFLLEPESQHLVGRRGEEGKDSFHAHRFVTCGNGDKTYCSAETLHKLISISQAECRVDIGTVKIDVSLGVMQKKGELGNDKYEKGGAQPMTALLHDRGRDRRAGRVID
ncbi:hypothetical protein V8E52_004698 [Russula decolorans]